MSEDAILEFGKFRASETTLDNLKISVITEFVNEYKITSEDLPMIENIVRYIDEGVHIERVPYGEDLEIIKPELDGSKESEHIY